MNQVHLFTNAGLGKAPFKCVGLYSIPSKFLAESNPDAYNGALRMMPRGYGVGSCAYCGTSLVNNYLINSADGKKFSVGCDCVEKVGDRGLVSAVKLAKKKADADKRHAERMAKWAAIDAARKAEEELERQRNGGLTDAELERKREVEIRDKKVEILAPIAKVLRETSGDFALSMYQYINDGEIPSSERAKSIVVDIYCKAKAKEATGKTRGKVFEDAKGDYFEAAWAMLEAVENFKGE